MLLGVCAEFSDAQSIVTIIHPTRENAYPKVQAPHPIYHWLNEHGHVRVGNLTVPLKCFSAEFAGMLAQSGITGFAVVSGFLDARDPETELRTRLAWRKSKLTPESNSRVWEQIFAELATRKASFKDLRSIWELAHTEGAIPSTVLTADGPLPIAEVYVTTDSSVGHDLDDGRIVLLSAAAASAWAAASARTLGSGPTMAFESRLSSPSYLLDLFPELAMAQADSEKLGSILAAWVKGF